MSSLNEVQLIGNLGADPEVKHMHNGKPVCNLRLATTENWNDRATGERKERTEWHRVVIFSEGICKVAENYLRKGSKIYIRGQLQNRQYEQDGITKYATEIVLQGFNAKLLMLDGKQDGGAQQNNNSQSGGFDDSIPW